MKLMDFGVPFGELKIGIAVYLKARKYVLTQKLQPGLNQLLKLLLHLREMSKVINILVKNISRRGNE